MALRTLVAFVGAFMSILLFLLVQEPYALNFKAQDAKIAQMEMHVVKDYEITTDGVNSIINAKKAMRFSDRDEFYEVDGIVRDEGLVNTLRANKAISHDGIIELHGDVYYVRSDDFTLKSEQVIYNREKKELFSDVAFEVTYGPHQSTGESFNYQVDSKILKADKIRANIKVEQL